MKKIALWKLFLFGTLTFGVYYIVWLAKRRLELQKASKAAIPHWIWLVAPPALSFLLSVPIAFISYGLTLDDFATATVTFGFLMLFLTIAFAISLWWLWKFSSLMEKAIYHRVPTGWAIAYWIFGTYTIIFIWQFYLNRLPKLRTSTDLSGPTHKFIALSIICLLLLAGLNLLSFAISLNDIRNASSSSDYENSEYLEDLDQESRDLQRDYDSCTEHLDLDFPEVTKENEDEYNRAYDACDKIYRQLDRAIREYNTGIQKA